MAKAKELRDQSLQELEAAYQDACKNLYELRDAFYGQRKREKPHLMGLAKKDIARLLTVITEKRKQK